MKQKIQAGDRRRKSNPKLMDRADCYREELAAPRVSRKTQEELAGATQAVLTLNFLYDQGHRTASQKTGTVLPNSRTQPVSWHVH